LSSQKQLLTAEREVSLGCSPLACPFCTAEAARHPCEQAKMMLMPVHMSLGCSSRPYLAHRGYCMTTAGNEKGKTCTALKPSPSTGLLMSVICGLQQSVMQRVCIEYIH